MGNNRGILFYSDCMINGQDTCWTQGTTLAWFFTCWLRLSPQKSVSFNHERHDSAKHWSIPKHQELRRGCVLGTAFISSGRCRKRERWMGGGGWDWDLVAFFSEIEKKTWGNASLSPVQWVFKKIHQLWLIKCVLDVLVVVHCPIGLMPPLGCVGAAGCQLNFPYVRF